MYINTCLDFELCLLHNSMIKGTGAFLVRFWRNDSRLNTAGQATWRQLYCVFDLKVIAYSKRP